MPVTQASTLVDALSVLPRGDDRGFRFRGLDGTERFFPWREVEREATRRAACLLGAGLKKADRLALVIGEPHEFVLTFLGAVVGGVVPVPIYPRAGFKAKNSYVDTVTHIVTAAGARMLATMESTKPVVEELLARDTPLEQLLIVETLFAGETPSVALPTITPSDLCFLQFTSGSTSLPKGVVVTHANLVANANAFLGPSGLARKEDDIAITWLPLFHDMGLIGFVLGTLLHDIPTVLLPTESFARRPTMWMEAMSQYGGTITFAPNFAYGLAAKRTRDKDLEGLNLSRLRVAGCGAEPINPRVMRTFAERFASVGFDPKALMPSYGMAEATLAITFHDHGTEMITDRVSAAAMQRGTAEPATEGQDQLELVSCGHAFPGHEISILSEDGTPLGERQVGEIVVRGPSVTSGYYQNPEATASGYKDGALHTGDLGYLDGSKLYVCGRIKDLIIIRGANFHPQDIEWAVAEGNSTDATELRKAIATKVVETCALSPGHVSIVRVGSLPKTSSGKAQRRRTKQLFEQGQLEEHPA